MLQFYIPEVKGVEQVKFFFINNSNKFFCFLNLFFLFDEKKVEDEVDAIAKKEFEKLEENLNKNKTDES